uniref:Uncharacterized protein n=1 Tax=Naja naja TaxID=35670 RepID=A0A8C6XFZ4_NAJNA
LWSPGEAIFALTEAQGNGVHAKPIAHVLPGVFLFSRDGGQVAIETVVKFGAQEFEEQTGSAEDVGAEHFHVRRGQAVDLRSFPHGEMNRLGPLVQSDVEHRILLGFRELHFLLQESLNERLDLIKVRFSPKQAHFLEVLGQVQVRRSQEVEDVAENFAVSVNEAVALAVSFGGHLPAEHGAQHGVWKAGE